MGLLRGESVLNREGDLDSVQLESSERNYPTVIKNFQTID
jgi:hypothetical protein